MKKYLLASLLAITIALNIFAPTNAQSIITNHGGKPISNPQYHLIFEGKYDPILQAELTMFVKDIAPNPDSTILQYDPGAAGTLVSTASGPTSMTVGVSQAQADVDSVAGKPSFIARLFLLFNDRINGNANDVWIICCAPWAKPVEWGYHSYLTDRKGLLIVCTYSSINSMTYGISHEISECCTNPLCGNGGWYGFSTSQEIGDLCEPQTKQVTLNGVTYTVAKIYDLKSGTCK